MPPKKRGGQSSKGQRLDEMARKKDERAMRAAHRKERKAQESYLADDENFASFANQLAKMALQLRDIPGDGNCLFRALGDQLEGHGRNHMTHRLDVVEYMHGHRDDFEPFVEDDVPFERHVSQLKKPGTYAGNDAIVAFARLNKVVVVIHQLNSPCWTIQGTDKPNARQLHISYHNGDHYSSVRKMGDNTESPACISISTAVQQGQMPQSKSKPGKSSSHNGKSNGNYHSNGYPHANNYHGNHYGSGSMYDSYSSGHSSSYSSYDSPLHYSEDSAAFNLGPEYEEPHSNSHKSASHNGGDGIARAIRDSSDVVLDVMRETGCQDASFVQQVLEENFYDVDAAIGYILQVLATSTPTNGYGATPVFPSPGSNDSGIWSENGTATRIHGGPVNDNSAAGAKPKKTVSTSRMKRDKKMEKKMRATERRREQLLRGEMPPPDYDNGENDDDTYTVTQDMGTLKI